MRVCQFVPVGMKSPAHINTGYTKFSGNNKNLCLYHKLGIQLAHNAVGKAQPVAPDYCGDEAYLADLEDLEKIEIIHI